MTDAELTLRLRANLIAFKRLQVERGRLVHQGWPGVDAFAVATRPRDLNLQQAVYADVGALADALPGLEQFYRDLGVPAWRVLTPGGDRAGQILTRAGYRPEGALPAMGLAFDCVARRATSVALRELEQMDELAALNVTAYGAEWADVLSAWRGPPPPRTHALAAGEPGRAVACGLSLDVGDTAGIYLVATQPAARRRGLGTAIMCGLLEAARERGLAASVLQATDEGFGLYRRLGYRDLGVWTHWVRRRAA
ncbi:MAG TPA: GNAT family N-acetyltransferase [Polyangiaceae bacterium]|nr:GNAT family N-acetyltransferase [Polyangiaceae bacterium]